MKKKLIQVIVEFPFTDDFDKIELEIDNAAKYASSTGAGCGMGVRDISYELPENKFKQFNKDVANVLNKHFNSKKFSISKEEE